MRRHGRLAAVVAAVSTVGVLGGCVGWSSYPAEPGQRVGADPNDMHMTDVMVAGMNWVVRKYPVIDESAEPSPDGTVNRVPFTVNLPPELKPLIHKRTVSRINGAVPLTPATQELPTYHIASVRVRGDAAQVNILRPVTTMAAAPNGEKVYQEIRVELRGGLKEWTVIGHREWTPTPASPTLAFFDEEAARRAEASLGGG